MGVRYITTAIPYVNADPHVGHALELVQADVLARHARRRGHEVRFLSGTDENAAKNVTAAREARVPVGELVERNAVRFVALCDALDISTDDFIRTSSDPRHRPTVERLWNACVASGDLYKGTYRGRYCRGCEAFVDDDRCDEHDAEPDWIEEENWFFRLSRYRERLPDAVAIEPRTRRNEVASFLAGDVADVSVSRPADRSDGWGIPVPGDPTQIVYVWFDALANYLAADPARWRSSDDRTHVIGKGILRFHAVLWPAVLLSAGEPLPTRILVHEYLTSEGRKLSKSAGNVVDPFEVVERLGAEALRWWFVRDVARTSDTDFSIERVEARYAEDLAGGIGNLVRRIGTLARKLSLEPGPPADTGLAGRVDEAIEAFDLRGASGAIVEAVGEVNRLLELHRPWELLRTDRVAAQDAVSRARSLALEIVGELEPFLPSAVARLHSALDGGEAPFERVQPAPAARSIC